MGLVSGGLNGHRFRITTPLPEGFRDVYLENVRDYAFEDQPTATEPVMGWVDVFEPANTSFELNTFLFDHFVALSMRLDKKAVNGRYFKIALQRRFDEVMEERGLEKLNKEDKEAIKDALEADLLSRALPSVGIHDLVWDVNNGEVIVFATSEPVLELFRGLVVDTFGAKLRPERMVDWLHDKLDANEIAERIDIWLPGGRRAHGTGAVIDGWREDDMLEGHERALASDFLTWLWLQSESTDGLFRVIDGAGAQQAALDKLDDDADDMWNDVTESLKRADLNLWLESRLKLQEPGEDSQETTILLGAAPSTTDEARRNLIVGKRPVEACLGLKLGDLECSMSLSAAGSGLQVRGLKLPFEVKTGQEEKIYERMFLLDLVHTTLKQLFQQFFLERTSPAWNDKLDRWMGAEMAAK